MASNRFAMAAAIGVTLVTAIGFAAGGAGESSRRAPRSAPNDRVAAPAGGAAAQGIPLIDATKSDALQVETIPDGQAQAGETLRYTVTITNTGGDNALGVMFEDTIDPNTTLVPGSISTTPLARNDGYATVGNVTLSLAAPGVLANDDDPDGDSVTVLSNTATANGGTVTLAPNGSLEYLPPVGFEGFDSFMYTIQDDDGNTNDALVTITVTDMVWFIDNSDPDAGSGGCPGGLDGCQASPYATTTAFNADNGGAGATDPEAGDTVFIFNGNTAYTDGVELENQQELIGERVGLTVAPNLSIPAAGAGPTITNAAGHGITLADDNTIRGLTIGTTTGDGIFGTTVGTLTISDARIEGGGRALNVDGGTLNVGLDSIEVTSSATDGIRILNAGGNLAVTGAVSISSTGDGVSLNTNTSDFDFGSLSITTSAGRGLFAVNGGTVNIVSTTTAINATGGAALDIDNTGGQTNAVSGWTFASLTSAGSTAEGIRLVNISDSFTVTGTTAVTDAGSTGIRVQGAPGVSIDFGSTTVTDTFVGAGATANGIDIATGNAGASFTFDTLSVTTDGGFGFRANGSGTVNFNSTAATINATGGAAVDITSTVGLTNGSSGWTFASLVSSSSPTEGIKLDSLTDDFTVSGATTITSSTNEGIEIDSSGASVDYTFATTSVTNSGQDGINLDSLDGSFTILSAGGGVFFTSNNDNNGIFSRGVGTISISGTNAANRFEVDGASMGTGLPDAEGIDIANSNAVTLDFLRVENIAKPDSSDDAVDVTNTRDSVTITNSVFTEIDGNAIDIDNETTQSTNDLTVTVTDNDIDGDGTFTNDITFGVQFLYDSATGNRAVANISDNAMDQIDRGIAVAIGDFDDATSNPGTGAGGRCEITIQDNILTDLDNDGIDVTTERDASVRFFINSMNDIDGLDAAAGNPDRGIDYVPGVFFGVCDITIASNTVDDVTDELIRLRGISDPSTGLIRALVDANIIRDTSVVTGDEAINIDFQEAYDVDATVTSNDIDVGAGNPSLYVGSFTGSASSSICLDARDNFTGAGAPLGIFELEEGGGTLDISQASIVAMGTANNNVAVVTSGTIGFNAFCGAVQASWPYDPPATTPWDVLDARDAAERYLEQLDRLLNPPANVEPTDGPWRDRILIDIFHGFLNSVGPEERPTEARTGQPVAERIEPASEPAEDVRGEPAPVPAADTETNVEDEPQASAGAASPATRHETARGRSTSSDAPSLDRSLAAICRAMMAYAGIGSPINIGTMNPGETITITFDAQINDPLPMGTTQVANQGTVTGTNFADVLTDDPATGAVDDATVTPIVAPPVVEFSQATPYQVRENGAIVGSAVTLTRTGDLGGATTVLVSITGGTATAGADYNGAAFPLMVTFAAASAMETVPVPILQDPTGEPTENVTFAVTAVSNAMIGAQNTAALEILDDETVTTIVSDLPDPSVTDQTVTIVYSVTSTGGTPTGTVTVSDGTQMCTGSVAAGMCTIAFDTAGARTLTATYSGDADFQGSTSATEMHTVNKNDTTTTIVSDNPEPSLTFEPVTVVFTVVGNPTAATPTGMVMVSDGTETCMATVAVGQCVITPMTPGAKTITATYMGDANFNGSMDTEPHQVNDAPGACCLNDGSCVLAMLVDGSDCISAGGDYQGVNTLCMPNPCPQPGACCMTDGSCMILADVDGADCVAGGGAYEGPDTLCMPNPCPQPGACCMTDGTCALAGLVDGSDCVAGGGAYEGPDTLCMPNPCPQPGACCMTDGTCALAGLVDGSDCVAGGGAYEGPDTLCMPNPCPQPGACCMTDGTCALAGLVDGSDCVAGGGAYEGPDTLCIPSPCPQPGACCFPDGSCALAALVDGSDCTAAGAVYNGQNTVCGIVTCVQPGACCFDDGSCDQAPQIGGQFCQLSGGTYQGNDTTCAGVDCPAQDTGACCLPADGSCIRVTPLNCLEIDGVYQGDDTFCALIGCPQPPTGACCFYDASCAVDSEFGCGVLGGNYQGDGTACAAGLCPAGNTELREGGSEKGSLLFFDGVELRWRGIGPCVLLQDTFVSLANDYPGDVNVQMYFINGDPPLEAVYDAAGNEIERAHPGWNWVDNGIELTANEATYWSVLTGQPKGVSPFTVLDPGGPMDMGRPAADGTGDRVLRGYIVAWAVNNLGAEIRWNHLGGTTTVVNYDKDYACEANASAFAVVDSAAAHGQPTGTPGVLGLDGVEYAPAPAQLLVNFQAAGSGAFSDPPPIGFAVISGTQLTLHPASVDLRQTNDGPVTTKASFDIWNENETKFSGTHHCITCWDQTLVSQYDVPNHFRRQFLQTDHGKARVDGLPADDCDDIAGGVVSRQAALLGVATRLLAINDVAPNWTAAASANLVGLGYEPAEIRFDPVGDPPELQLPMDPTIGDIEDFIDALLERNGF